MNFDPQKLFIGLVDFFSILLPGALLTFLLAGDLGPVVLGNGYNALTGSAAWAAFLFASYLAGHLVFLLGSWLDEIYDWIRGYTANEQIRRLARGGAMLPWPIRAMVWLVFKHERNVAVDRVGKIKEKALHPVRGKHAVNNFQWCKALLSIESPASLAAVNRFEADSKFFRCFTVVVLLLLAGWPGHQKWPRGGVPVALALLMLSLWRYMEQRFKSTNQAYWSVITLTALQGKLTIESPPGAVSRAGGVVFRKRDDVIEFLLVEAKDDPGTLVLPKGKVEDGEDQRETAVREVHEEAGVWARVVEPLRDSTFDVKGNDITVRFYLMESLGRGMRKDRFRGNQWLAMTEACKKAKHAETRALIETAAERLKTRVSS